MDNEKTVVLGRENHVLWVYRGGVAEGLYYNVTGVERLSYSPRYPISVLQNGRIIGFAWDITEIKEEW